MRNVAVTFSSSSALLRSALVLPLPLPLPLPLLFLRLNGGYSVTLPCPLTDFKRRHQQLSEWIRQDIVPKPSVEPVLGCGQLKSVWLGGLVNPGALVTSLRHEKAAMAGCGVEEVCLRKFFQAICLSASSLFSPFPIVVLYSFLQRKVLSYTRSIGVLDDNFIETDTPCHTSRSTRGQL